MQPARSAYTLQQSRRAIQAKDTRAFSFHMVHECIQRHPNTIPTPYPPHPTSPTRQFSFHMEHECIQRHTNTIPPHTTSPTEDCCNYCAKDPDCNVWRAVKDPSGYIFCYSYKGYSGLTTTPVDANTAWGFESSACSINNPTSPAPCTVVDTS